jgi:hypothetical protein
MTDPSNLPQGQADQAAAGSLHRLAYRGAARVFWVILALSVALLALSLIAIMATPGRQPTLAEPAPASSLVLVISTATSIVSLIGLLSTNLLAWRREAREARSAEIELERQRLEIEKLRLELEKQKRAQ